MTALGIQASIRSHSRGARHHVSSLDDVATERREPEHPSLLPASLVAARVPARGRRTGKPGAHRNAEYRCGRSRLLARCADLFSLLETPATFVIEPAAAKSWPQRLFLRFADTCLLDSTKPLDLRALVREARRGRRLVLFLDTRSAVAGRSMMSFDVAALVAEKSDALVTTVRLAGAERTFFSRIAAAYVGRRLLPKVKLTVLPPRRLSTPSGLRGPTRRQARRLALYDRMAELQFLTFDTRRTLHAAFEASAKALSAAERNRGSRVSPRANGRLVSTAPPCEVCNRQ